MEHLTTTLLVLLSAVATGWACYPPFQEVGGSCYYIDTERAVGWSEARAFCQSMGGADLVVFDSCDAFSLFSGYLAFNAPVESTFWVGAHTEFIANNWKWVNGMSLASGVPFWGYREGHDDDQDCAAMDSESFFQLSDFACDKAMNYVCQLPAEAYDQDVPENPLQIHCPPDSVQVGDFCYWFSDTMETWADAETICRNNFTDNMGELFSPSSCDEFTKMAHHLDVAEREKSHWVGAADSSGNQEWFWVSGDAVPGGPPFWASNEPDDHYHSNYCGQMSHFRSFYLADERCSTELHFVCKLHSV